MNHEDHDDIEGHESHSSRRYRMRLPSPLTPEADRVMSDVIGCAIRVHRALGPGFLESIYQKAMHAELAATGPSYESERPVRVKYRDIEIPGQRVDLIVGRLIVVELKSVMRLDEIHRAPAHLVSANHRTSRWATNQFPRTRPARRIETGSAVKECKEEKKTASCPSFPWCLRG